jgi:acylphosphatase
LDTVKIIKDKNRLRSKEKELSMEKRRILIKGKKVHNVGYRAFLLDEAEAILIPNFSARNIKNETEIVEVLVGGNKEKIDTFINFIKNNYPEAAEIIDISVEDYDGEIRTIEAYSRSFSASQLSKIAITGVSLLKNQKEDTGLTRAIIDKQEEHINITKVGLHSITQELKSFEGVHKEILELRQEITVLKNTVSRIEKMVEA